ncbi:hypothetical protein KFK09_005826 [Dendrobium nobile]|uniref:Uncharacterized protein n=1 Tax=Dendrobium nobile TaxID=94219 RepID=A0A8T3BZC8_DENNO|nr:hypothetical protein KFK09_005826 [Dendrobium nobile]
MLSEKKLKAESRNILIYGAIFVQYSASRTQILCHVLKACLIFRVLAGNFFAPMEVPFLLEKTLSMDPYMHIFSR